MKPCTPGCGVYISRLQMKLTGVAVPMLCFLSCYSVSKCLRTVLYIAVGVKY